MKEIGLRVGGISLVAPWLCLWITILEVTKHDIEPPSPKKNQNEMLQSPIMWAEEYQT